MLRSLNVPVKNLDGNDLKEPSDNSAVTLSSVCTNSLLFQDQSSNLTGDQKLARFALAKKIHDEKGSVDLTAEEIVLIKDCVNKLFNPLVYGRLIETLEEKK